MGPRILRIWTVLGKIRRQTFQIIGNRQDGANPCLKVRKSLEGKQICNSFSVRLPDLSQDPHELHKARVAERRRRAGTPKVGFRDFLGDHLQVLQQMALGTAFPEENHENVVVRSCLSPPDFLLQFMRS